MAKHEPWFKPRADEDADEELINWLGGNPPPGKGGGCGLRVVSPAVGVLVASLLLVMR